MAGGEGGWEPDRPWREIVTGGADRLRPEPPVRDAWRELTQQPAVCVKQLTGANLDTTRRWRVAGTDLGIPYLLENGSVGFLFGDTFASAWPEDGDDWRSPVMLRSNVHPAAPGGIVFDSAARVQGDGRAPQLMDYMHFRKPFANRDAEITRIPNDGVSFPETGRQVLSYMAVYDWPPNQPWLTGRAGLAYSDNGNDFHDVPAATWPNDAANVDPYQMWTMQRDRRFVYVFSVRAGRQQGPMMLRRVPWQRILEPEAYEPFGWRKETGWRWGQPCTSVLQEAPFGEPSVRLLRDGVWAMTYSLPRGIVSRRAERPEGPWSYPKVQLTDVELPALYGGFIHPYSTSAVGDLHLTVSTWLQDPPGTSRTYHVSQYAGTL
ncbi:MAG: DUF4185 domain-containing protein [Hamadaea sp.]|uniref:DUF4185 domain-containing protein n=1 Tax=Hamadaea sp. TaxID=2024425 RepID=UPI001826785D|nr:DUF4185 domain-containing protein [Hamadaea sp.]NUR72818.1 DUF4185 domain-containing protein [Hamadaea sp.]NUT20467.1 DUF4185 domain-containing protein [Hamadaea sp.]